MSKKLIAVAAAAALALSALAPANAAGASLTVAPTSTAGVQEVPAGTGLTSTTAYEVPVPSQDVLRVTGTTNRTAIEFSVNTRSNGASITVASTGGVELLTTAQVGASGVTTATGVQSLTMTSDSNGLAKFVAYSTSTTAASIVVTESGSTPASNTIFVKGTTAKANGYTITTSVPSLAAVSALIEFDVVVKDMFGNAIESLTGSEVDVTTLGGTLPVDGAWSSTRKVYEGSVTNRSTAGSIGVQVALEAKATKVAAFGNPVQSLFFTVSAADLQAAVTALQAQVAALTADYNALAKKFNTKVKKKNRVTLK
jgi:hypothetical protein